MTAKPDNIPEGDFANYFCTYGYLYHQKEMLEDQQRMQAYYNAIFQNESCFKDKAVLDVGTGSGILAIWAAKAGARKVYAVEATYMADHARTLVKANGVDHIVEVFQTNAEDLVLPEQVDIIVSEWMGYFLLRESMLDSVIKARDKWMKPGGSMYPSHAQMFLAPIRGDTGRRKEAELKNCIDGWTEFADEVKDRYGVDFSCLAKPFEQEQAQYLLETGVWSDIHPNQLVGEPCMLASYDLNTLKVEDIQRPRADWQLRLKGLGSGSAGMPPTVDGLAGWFEVQFRGSEQNPAEQEVELTTAPDEHGATHWGQQAFYLHPPQRAADGDVLKGTFEMVRRSDNHRLMTVSFVFSHGREGPQGLQLAPAESMRYNIE